MKPALPLTQERPVPAEQVGPGGDRQQHGGEQEVEAQARPAEQHGIAHLVDHEASGGHDEEAQRGLARRGTVPAEGERMVAGERDAERHEPADHVRRQRLPAPVADQGDDDEPMHRRSDAADQDEPGDTRPVGELAHHSGLHGRKRSICICVDDFGLHAGINEAAVRLAAMERVHAIACLVGADGWGVTWCALLRRLDASGVDIGLHLDLSEAPLLPGSRRQLPSLIGRSLLHCLDAANIRAEVRAQLDAFEQVLGHGPAFVDGHQHVHQLPVVRRELLEELACRYAGKLPWLRSTQPAAVSGLSLLKARTIQALGSHAMNASARRMGFVQNNRLLGVYDFEGGAGRFRSLLAAWLGSAREADLLMCHASVRAYPGDALAGARLAEYEVLAGEGFVDLLRHAGVVLRPMSRILEQRAARPA